MLELYLIRNGETEENAKFQNQSHSQGVLSVRGLQQAKSLKQAFAGDKIKNIYSSSLKRATDTCRFAELGENVLFMDELKERNLGEAAGISYLEVVQMDPTVSPKNGESLVDMQNRVGKFLDKIVQQEQTGKIVIFSHHDFILSCIAYVIKLDVHHIYRLMISNASITQLDFHNQQWIAKRINELGHLGDLKQTYGGEWQHSLPQS